MINDEDCNKIFIKLGLEQSKKTSQINTAQNRNQLVKSSTLNCVKISHNKVKFIQKN